MTKEPTDVYSPLNVPHFAEFEPCAIETPPIPEKNETVKENEKIENLPLVNNDPVLGKDAESDR